MESKNVVVESKDVVVESKDIKRDSKDVNPMILNPFFRLIFPKVHPF